MRLRLRFLGFLVLFTMLLTTFAAIDAEPAEAQGSYDVELIRLANDHRASLGLPRLATSSSISAASLRWSQHMKANGWGHDSLANIVASGAHAENIAFSGGSPGSKFGVSWSLSAGSLPSYCKSSMDYTTAEFTMCQWLSSSGHRSAIENPSYRQIGSGTHIVNSGSSREIWSTHRFSRDAPSNPAPTPTPPPPAPTPTGEPGHTVAANAAGDEVIIGLSASGDLSVRRDLGQGLSSWNRLGTGNFASADVAIAHDGTAHVAAIKEGGQMYTFKWKAAGGFPESADHGGGWDPTTTPSIAANARYVFLGAITKTAHLKTKILSRQWTVASTQGGAGWVSVDVDLADDNDLWFVGVRTNGIMFMRNNLGVRWSGWNRLGAPTWSRNTPPAVAASSDEAVIGGVNVNGLLYTRRYDGAAGGNWVRHGNADWASIDVAMNEGGVTWIAAHKTWGRLYTRSQSPSGAWTGWTQHSGDIWAAASDASITVGASNHPSFIAVTDGGNLYHRTRSTAGWSGWSRLGSGSWATGN